MCSGVKTRAFICLTLYVLGLPACEEAPSPPELPPRAPEQPSPPGPTPPAPASPTVEEIVQAPSAEPPSAPSARLANLADEAARFSTFDACIAALPSLAPLTLDALDELGLASLTRDTCRLVEAVHGKSVEPCKAVLLDALEARCLVAVAVARGEADLCPAVDAHDFTRGRDALCLALAARRTQPCDALEASDAITCRATAHQERALCKDAPTQARRQACLRSVERWRGLVGPLSEPSREATRATLERSEGSREFEELARTGAVIVERGGKRRIAVDASRGRTRLKLRARLDASGGAELEGFELTEAGVVLAKGGPTAQIVVVLHEGDAGTPTALTATVRAGHRAEGFVSFVLTTPVRDRLSGPR